MGDGSSEARPRFPPRVTETLEIGDLGRSSGEKRSGRGHDLVVRDIAQVLTDVPAVAEGILELAVAIAPEHVRQRLAHECSRGDRSGEYRLGVGDLKREHDWRSPDRWRGKHAHLRELVGDMQETIEVQLGTDINLPSGVGIRSISSAPKASR